MNKLRVIFVAGLEPMPDGGFGGQLAAATTLLQSPIRQLADFIPLSSTMESIPPPGLPVRAASAIKRVSRFTTLLPRADVALVFAADGFSLLEKGLMCMLARAGGRGVVVRLSSGHLPGQCEKYPLLRRWLRLTLRAAHVVCVQGPSWRRYYEQYPDAAGKVVEIRNGIQVNPPRARARSPGHRIAFVGWMQREKGIFDVLDALQSILKSHPDTHLTCAGGGRDFQAIRESVERRGLEQHVTLCGWISKAAVRELLFDSDVFLLPSHAEGLPNAMLEAMAEGTPVVATSVGSVPDVIEHGVSGQLIDVGDVAAITRAVVGLFDDHSLAARLAANARKRVEEEYSIETVWRQFANALDRAAREAGRTDTTPETSLLSR